MNVATPVRGDRSAREGARIARAQSKFIRGQSDFEADSPGSNSIGEDQKPHIQRSVWTAVIFGTAIQLEKFYCVPETPLMVPNKQSTCLSLLKVLINFSNFSLWMVVDAAPFTRFFLMLLDVVPALDCLPDLPVVADWRARVGKRRLRVTDRCCEAFAVECVDCLYRGTYVTISV